uniref:glucuronosyltransferase n=1 Tax=Meloidogyne floridensis TaxID=298350 RepID=A0A915NJ17_9BILA
LFHRRFKRGNCCSGGEGATDDHDEGFTRRPGKEPMREVEQDMLVYTKNGGKTINPKNFQVIHVPINYKNIDEYKNSSKYHTIGIYKEIITNQSGILDRLRKDENNNIKYDIGIAEFNVMAGSFAVFEALGIEETFDVSNSVFNPQYLQFLGINVLDYQSSRFNLAKPGDWVNGEWQKDRDENRSEHEVINRLIQKLFTSTSHDLYDSLFDDLKLAIEKPSTLDVLFKKIKYHFINQHPLIKFNEFPEDDKIVYIGGILFYCHVLVSFGTMDYIEMYPILYIIRQVFVKFPHCYFHIRATGNSTFDNGYTTKDPLPQKEILSHPNTRVFISHCGINSVNEMRSDSVDNSDYWD